MEYVGFKPHKPGRIHLYCPGCGRKLSNMRRFEGDPERAVLAHIPCERCSVGCKIEGPSAYLDANGKTIYWDEPRASGEKAGESKPPSDP
jgi:hypothetical protein